MKTELESTHPTSPTSLFTITPMLMSQSELIGTMFQTHQIVKPRGTCLQLTLQGRDNLDNKQRAYIQLTYQEVLRLKEQLEQFMQSAEDDMMAPIKDSIHELGSKLEEEPKKLGTFSRYIMNYLKEAKKENRM